MKCEKRPRMVLPAKVAYLIHFWFSWEKRSGGHPCQWSCFCTCTLQGLACAETHCLEASFPLGYNTCSSTLEKLTVRKNSSWSSVTLFCARSRNCWAPCRSQGQERLYTQRIMFRELFGIAPKLDFAKPCLLQKVKFLLFFNSRLKFCEQNLRKFFYDPMGFIKVRKKAIHYCAR